MALYTAVHFRCRGTVDFGFRLAVVGDHVALGDWNAKCAHALQVSATFEDVWNSVSPALLPLRERREYRYAVLDASGEFVRWHDEGARFIDPTGNEMLVEDDDGYYRSECSSSLSLSDLQRRAGQLLSLRSDDEGDSTTPLRVIQMLQRLDVDPKHTVYFVTSRLPIQVHRCADGGFATRECNTPLTTTLWQVRHRFRNKMRFIGACSIVQDAEDTSLDSVCSSATPRSPLGSCREIPHDEFTVEEKEQLRALLAEYDCIPVFVPSSDLVKSLQFCKQHLWHLFYNIGLWDVNEQQEFDWDLWNAYVSVSRQYASVAYENACGGDFFWVHDYKLLMVPHFITRRMKSANIGIFMHAMFPPYSLFSCLAVREAVLRSMLCADLIGFQFFEFARHFLTCCKRLLGLDHSCKLGGMLDIQYNGREVMILLSHSHIQPDVLAAMLDPSGVVPELAADFRKKWPSRFIIASVDRDARLAGLFLKLKAFRKYLAQYPVARGKVLLVQYVCATDTLWEGRTDVMSALESVVESINAEYGKTHVLLECNVPASHKYALFVAADCFLDTSIRGGINMCAFEYIYCRRGQSASAILSEFVGFSRMLLSAIRVNPWHVENVMDALDQVMSTRCEERVEMSRRDYEYVVSNDAVAWVDHFVRELFCARKKQDMRHLTWGFGKTFKTYSLSKSFTRLNAEHVLPHYESAKRRLLFLDCEGTLCPSLWEKPPRSSYDIEQTIKHEIAPLECNVASVRLLASNPLNVVVVISVRDRGQMEKQWFPDQPDLGICAGYGLHYRVPCITGSEWRCMLDEVDDSWREPVLQIMEQYAHRTPGSYVESLEIMVVFQYHHSDPEFGATQSTELYTVLKDIMSHYPVDVLWSKWNVQVRVKGVSKGAALLHVAKRCSAVMGDFDFVLCMGDHRSDEEMFKALETLDQWVHGSAEGTGATDRRDPRYISCTIGMKPSKAMYYLNDHNEVSDLLCALTRV